MSAFGCGRASWILATRSSIFEKSSYVAWGGTGVAEPDVLAPGASGTIRVQMRLDTLGYANQVFVVTTDDPASPTYRAPLATFVQSAYQPEMPEIGIEIPFEEIYADVAFAGEDGPTTAEDDTNIGL